MPYESELRAKLKLNTDDAQASMNDFIGQSRKKFSELAREQSQIISQIMGASPMTATGRFRRGAIADQIQDLEKAAKAQQKMMKDRVTFMKDMSFLMMPVFNPGSVWATLFSTRQTFSAMNTERGQSMLARFGLSGVGGAAAGTAALVAGATGAGFALMGLKKAAEGARDAIQKAFGIYTGAAQAGLSTRFFSQRQALANVLGITGDPNQVFQFGKSVQYVMERTRGASNIMSRFSRPLAQVEMNFRIMKLDFDALYSVLASKAEPALNKIIGVFDLMSKTATAAVGPMSIIAGGIGNAAKRAFLANHPVLAYLNAITSSEQKMLLGGGGKIPPMLGNMKQLPASTWEHMGLAIGGGGQTTNMLIKQGNNILKMIYTVLKSGSTAGSTTFGLSPLIANP